MLFSDRMGKGIPETQPATHPDKKGNLDGGSQTCLFEVILGRRRFLRRFGVLWSSASPPSMWPEGVATQR